MHEKERIRTSARGGVKPIFSCLAFRKTGINPQVMPFELVAEPTVLCPLGATTTQDVSKRVTDVLRTTALMSVLKQS